MHQRPLDAQENATISMKRRKSDHVTHGLELSGSVKVNYYREERQCKNQTTCSDGARLQSLSCFA